MILILLAAVATADAPRGDRLRAADQCFALIRDGKDGPVTVGATRQVIRKARFEGKPVWDIVNHQKVAVAGFELRDHFVLARRDLSPIAFDNRKNGEAHVTLRYATDGAGMRIAGTRIEKGVTTSIDVRSPKRVWEGNLWAAAFGALPLAAGKQFSLPFYQYDKGFGRFEIAVTGSETVATPGGPVDAWTLSLTQGAKPGGTLLIGKRDGSDLGARAPGFLTRPGGDCSGLG